MSVLVLTTVLIPATILDHVVATTVPAMLDTPLASNGHSCNGECMVSVTNV